MFNYARPFQGDQIGQNFAIWRFFMAKLPNDLGKILVMKKSPKIDFNKAKILFQKSYFTCLKKGDIFKKLYLLFLCKKNYKRMSSAIGYKHKIKQKTP
jgi:hypothetical protein